MWSLIKNGIPSLTSLDISENKISVKDNSVDDVLGFLRGCTNLQNLNLNRLAHPLSLPSPSLTCFSPTFFSCPPSPSSNCLFSAAFWVQKRSKSYSSMGHLYYVSRSLSLRTMSLGMKGSSLSHRKCTSTPTCAIFPYKAISSLRRSIATELWRYASLPF